MSPSFVWVEDLAKRRFAFFGQFEQWPRYLGKSPQDAVLARGGEVYETLGADLNFVVFGGGRGKGKTEAQRKVQALQQKGAELQVLDEAGFVHLLRPKLDGARFHFAGELSFGRGGAATAPDALVQTLGASVSPKVDADLDFLVVCERRGQGKAAALAAAEKLKAAGAKLQMLAEEDFVALLSAFAGAAGVPVQAASPLAELLVALPGVTDAGRIKRALEMLRRESMQLFANVDEQFVAGIVRSQTGYSSYYSTRLSADGRFSCCDSGLDWCMGMGGGVCKHLLVLLLGLVQSGQLDAATARNWLAAAKQGKTRRPAGGESIKDQLADTILRYKSAAAGEIDWRPTETVPEDYYAF